MNIKKLKELGFWIEDDLSQKNIPEPILRICSGDFVKTYKIIPLMFDEVTSTLSLVTSNERNFRITYLLKSLLSVENINLFMTNEPNIENAAMKYYNILNLKNEELRTDELEEETVDQEEIAEEDSAITQRTYEMIALALEKKATDIHILPNDKQVRIFFKINYELIDFSSSVHASLLKKVNDTYKLANKIKVMCEPSLNISANMPQSGAIPFMKDQKKVDCRVSVMPSIRGESIVIRLLNENNEFKQLDKIGYSAETIAELSKVLARPGGLVIVTGPVNSGKSTSLYACLNFYDFDKKFVVTIEDPVEQKNENILQIQTRYAADEKNNLTFAKALREVLRHDLNILLIGEIRDTETAEIAIQASLTGHKVFSTLHNKNVISTIDRLMNMGLKDKKALLSELSCVISQRLISTLCPSCAEEYTVDINDVQMLNEPLQKKLLGLKLKRPPSHISCSLCSNTGYAGLAVVEECLVLKNDIRDYFMTNPSLVSLKRYLSEHNFISLQDRALHLVLSGVTSIEKYLNTIPDED